MKSIIFSLLAFLLLGATAHAQPRPGAFTTVTTTDTSASSVCAGCPIGSTTPAANSGVTTASVNLTSGAPAITANKLYQVGGNLFFNGVGLATGSSVSGTTGFLSKFTSPSSLGNSIVSEAGTVLSIGGSVIAGSGAVGIIDATGKIPAVTSTYFANLNGSALTNLSAGSATYSLAIKGTNYTAVTSDQIILVNGAATITLYACGGNTGRWIEVKNVTANTIAVAAGGGNTIDGIATINVDALQAIFMVCDGTSTWYAL